MGGVGTLILVSTGNDIKKFVHVYSPRMFCLTANSLSSSGPTNWRPHKVQVTLPDVFSGLQHASHELHSRMVSETQIDGVSGFCCMEHGPTDARRFVGCLQSVTHYRFPITFAPRIGRRCHQEQKEAVFVDDCC